MEITMKNLTKQQKEFISRIYNLESLINDEKYWIEIADIICNNDGANNEYYLYLILQIIKKQNDDLFCSYENLLHCAYEVIK